MAQLCEPSTRLLFENTELLALVRWKSKAEYESDVEEGAEPKKGKGKKANKKSVKKGAKKNKPTQKNDAGAGLYSPGKYSEARKKFIADLRGEGASYASASTAWNSSEERTKLLAGMPASERKRRRFA